MALTPGPYCSYIHICTYVCTCASDFAKMYFCSSPLHREVASRSRQKCCSHKVSKCGPAQESRILTWAVAWLEPREDYGKIGLLWLSTFAPLMRMCVFMMDLKQPKCCSQMVLVDMSR